jgi:hypothetical protein
MRQQHPAISLLKLTTINYPLTLRVTRASAIGSKLGSTFGPRLVFANVFLMIGS